MPGRQVIFTECFEKSLWKLFDLGLVYSFQTSVCIMKSIDLAIRSNIIVKNSCVSTPYWDTQKEKFSWIGLGSNGVE